MRLKMLVLPALFVLAGFVTAQNETVYGEVVTNDANSGYFLRHTGWALEFSPRHFRDDWIGVPLKLMVANHGTSTAPMLKVDKAGPTTQILHLGKAMIGQEATGSVAGRPGSYVNVCFDEPDVLSWTPLTGRGVWMLGGGLCGFAEGFVTDDGFFHFSYDVPLLDMLVGRIYVAQAMIFDMDRVSFSNLDSVVVQPDQIF